MCLNVKRILYILAVVLHSHTATETSKFSSTMQITGSIGENKNHFSLPFHNTLYENAIIYKKHSIHNITERAFRTISKKLVSNTGYNRTQEDIVVKSTKIADLQSQNYTTGHEILNSGKDVHVKAQSIRPSKGTTNKNTILAKDSVKISSDVVTETKVPHTRSVEVTNNTREATLSNEAPAEMTFSESNKTSKETTPSVRKNRETTQPIERRQFYKPGLNSANSQIQKDPKIERLLAEYRGLVNKYGPGSQNAQNSMKNEINSYKYPEQGSAQNQHPGQQQYGLPNQGNISGYPSYRTKAPKPYIPIRDQIVSPMWSPKSKPGPGRDQPGGGMPEGYEGKLPEGYEGKLPEGMKPEDFKNLPEGAEGQMGSMPDMDSTADSKRNEAAGAATRFTTRTTTTRRRRRTTPNRVSLAEDCDYLAYYCLKAYDTGNVCGRTLFFTHFTFENYCMLDFVNCMERYDIWQIAHMGECFELKVLTEYLHYPYNDDYFLDNYYIVEDM